MKKRSIVFGAIVAALNLGTMTFAISSNINKEAEPLNADYYYDKTSEISGLFAKVTDPSTIQNGEDLIIVADGNKTFQFLVGASYHYWMTTEFNEFSHVFDNYIYAENVKGELVTFEKGTGDSPIDKKDDKNPFIDLDD